MNTRRLRVADVFREYWTEYDRRHNTCRSQRKAVAHILACRTAEQGGHLHRCENCGADVPMYNSCMDRHCPTCQSYAKAQWLSARRAELLPVEYFHTVFTVPHSLNALIDANRRILLGEFFGVAHWVLQHFADDPQWRLEGQLGFMSVLHTWTQTLQEHFHLHCVIPGGVWRGGRWISCRRRFLFGKQQLCDAFRNRYISRLAALRQSGRLSFSGGAAGLAEAAGWEKLIRALSKQRWVAEPRPTAAGPEHALDYLARYVHRVAISDNRIVKIADGQVTFSYLDRSDGNKRKVTTLAAEDFIHRFLYHVLPDGFVKIRYYGWLSSRCRSQALAQIRTFLNAETPPAPPEETPAERIMRLTGIEVRRCPCCGKPALVYVGRINPRSPREPP